MEYRPTANVKENPDQIFTKFVELSIGLILAKIFRRKNIFHDERCI